MSPQQIVAVLSRLLAVWLANHLPGQAYQIVFASNPSVDWSMTVFAVIGFVVELSVSLALWFFPLVVAPAGVLGCVVGYGLRGDRTLAALYLLACACD